MISTRQTHQVQSNLETWVILAEFSRCADQRKFADLMFTTPELIRKRLALGGKSALATAKQFRAVWCYIEAHGWPDRRGE